MCLNVVLVLPEIPQNTGAIGRLCVCLDATLHLIKPLGFQLDEKSLRRAGLDYWQHLDKKIHDSWKTFLSSEQPQRMFFSSTKGAKPYFEFCFKLGDYLIFGSESKGFPNEFYNCYSDHLYLIPMPGKNARSHNLANAVSIVVYEAFRQIQLSTEVSSSNSP